MRKEIKKELLKVITLAIRQFLAYLINKINSKYEYNKEYYVTTAKDSIDKRDYKFWIEYESRDKIKLPNKVDLYNGEQLDQKSTLHCVAYAWTQSINENKSFIANIEQKAMELVDVADVVNEIRKIDPKFDTEWTRIVNSAKALKNIWKAEKYENVMSWVEWVKKALYMWLTVLTGTNSIDWRETNKTNVAVKGNNGWHAIEINGYDDNLFLEDSKGNKYKGAFKVKNSWGEKWGDNWHFYLPYDLYDLLYNWKYVMYTNEAKTQEILDEKNLFDEEQRQIMEEMKNKWYWNGERANDNITRAETIFIMNKIIKNNNLK